MDNDGRTRTAEAIKQARNSLEGSPPPTGIAVQKDGSENRGRRQQHDAVPDTGVPGKAENDWFRKAIADRLAGRRMEILSLVRDGLSDQAIAHKLVLAESTVKNNLGVAYLVMGIQGRPNPRIQAVLKAQRLGLLPVFGTAIKSAAPVFNLKEAAILDLMRREGQDLSNNAIGIKLDLPEGTLRRLLHGIYGKLGAENKIQAIQMANGPLEEENWVEQVTHKRKRADAARQAEALRPTDEDIEILRFIEQGLGNKPIGSKLGLTCGATKNRIGKIFKKLGAPDRTAAVGRAKQLGWLPEDNADIPPETGAEKKRQVLAALSLNEAEALDLLVQYQPNITMASTLGIATHTVGNRVRSIANKLGAAGKAAGKTSRLDIIAIARGLLPEGSWAELVADKQQNAAGRSAN